MTVAAPPDLSSVVEPTLAVRGVAHRYGDVPVLENVDVQFHARRIHALLGENGAGKSTLLKIAAGLVVPRAGVVSPKAVGGAAAAVAYVEQHATLFESLSIFENVALGPWRGVRASVAAALTMVGLADTDGPVARLSLAERQLVLLARALHRRASVLLLDEPTALATPQESQRLYAVLRRLADAGATVVVVTHHLEEVLAFADDVTVLRRGLVSARTTRSASNFSEEALLVAMFGATLPELRSESAAGLDAGRLTDSAGRTVSVRCGEILAIAGMAGQGQDDLVAALRFGHAGGFHASCTLPVVALPADRHHDAMVASATVAANAMLGAFPLGARGLFVDDDALVANAADRVLALRVVMPSLEAPMTALSGGNQQKVVLSRVFAEAGAHGDAKVVLVVAEPTRGIDAAAARLVHERLVALARSGHAVVLVTSDWRELRVLASRYVVVWKHRIAGELPAGVDDDVLSRAMLAGGEGSAA
jgi:ABC-type sugar transport system ATPase subunit